ncbi:hypothetical protein PoB_006408800 [Plakobranchus ocellatus]|uniref:Integrase zinc-binding domain-containing protein n=1 Tax=Plakobranchus ocellatus TaxID=259542 RepID=A0AAV4D0L4_9GAST|nr:hypothetical protein PoB_006408800 [Plakobranchus ocellatus]
MDNPAASSSFDVNCSMSATESSKDNLQRSPKQFQTAFWKLKLVLFTLELKLDFSEQFPKNGSVSDEEGRLPPRGTHPAEEAECNPRVATAPPQACIYTGPNSRLRSIQQSDTVDDLFYTTILESSTINFTTRRDPVISQVMTFVKQNEWPSEDSIPQNIVDFYNRRHELTVQKECLMWGHRIIPPGKLHEKLLLTLHEGHLGTVKMKNVARGYFWWPRLDKEIETITKPCNGCASTQPDPLRTPLHPWQ